MKPKTMVNTTISYASTNVGLNEANGTGRHVDVWLRAGGLHKHLVYLALHFPTTSVKSFSSSRKSSEN